MLQNKSLLLVGLGTEIQSCTQPLSILKIYSILLVLFFLFCRESKKIETIEPHFSTPESTIVYYWKSLSKRDYKNALMCFLDFSEKHYNEKDIFPVPEYVDSLKVDSIIYLMIKGNKAEIHYKVALYRDTLKTIFKSGDRLIMSKIGWKIKDVIIPK